MFYEDIQDSFLGGKKKSSKDKIIINFILIDDPKQDLNPEKYGIFLLKISKGKE